MQLTGEKIIAASPEAVWAALIDPAFLKRLIPGCESMTGNPQDGYDVTVARKVGGLNARLAGRFDMSEVRPNRGCVLVGEGRGGAAGLAKGTALIDLHPEGEGTRLTWTIDAELGGRLAALPEFVVAMAARKVANGFAERFAAAVEGRPPQSRKGLLGRLTG